MIDVPFEEVLEVFKIKQTNMLIIIAMSYGGDRKFLLERYHLQFHLS